MRMLVTGGCGFVGSSVVRQAIAQGHSVFNIDKANQPTGAPSLEGAASHANYSQLIGDTTDTLMLAALMREYQPDTIVHLASERARRPGDSARHGLATTFSLLEAASAYFSTAPDILRNDLRVVLSVQASAFGSLEPDEAEFDESATPCPLTRSAGLDAACLTMAEAWREETGLPLLTISAGEVYGPWQSDDALVSSIVKSALAGEAITPTGALDASDWLHVDDLATGLILAGAKGSVGETYLLGARAERRVIDIARAVCILLDGKRPLPDGKSYTSLVQEPNETVPDSTPSRRVAINPDYAERRLGWRVAHVLPLGLSATVGWVLSRQASPAVSV